METQYKLSNGDIFEVNKEVSNCLEHLGLDEEEREKVAHDMARTAEWLIDSEEQAEHQPVTDPSASPVRPLANH